MSAKRTVTAEDGACQMYVMIAALSLTFLGFFVCLILIAADVMFSALSFFCYFTFVSLLGAVRADHRELYQIEGNAFEDWLAAGVCYAQVLVQLKHQVSDPVPQPREFKGDASYQSMLSKSSDLELQNHATTYGAPTGKI